LPEWIAEKGIGEARFALVDKDEIIEARIELEGIVRAGTALTATLLRAGRNGVARDGDGNEYLLPAGAPGIIEGAAFDMIVTRSAIPNTESWKRPLGRVSNGDGNDGQLAARNGVLSADWDELIDEARSGIVRFGGGELSISPTPAMTLIDVDGTLSAKELALAGARAAARAIRRLDIGGSIGIDFPTISGKAERQAVGEAIDAILPKPFERTAMNGFGFVQIVRPRKHASLVELAQDRAAFEARALLRRAGRETGAIRLAAHPAVIALLEKKADWISQLARQVGGVVGLRVDASLPISGGYAEPA